MDKSSGHSIPELSRLIITYKPLFLVFSVFWSILTQPKVSVLTEKIIFINSIIKNLSKINSILCEKRSL